LPPRISIRFPPLPFAAFAAVQHLMRTTLLGFAIAGVLACFALPVAPGATFNVANVAGLISAINTANSNGEPDTINLTPNGTYTLTAADNTTSNGANGLPAIRHESSNIVSDLVINGNGATLQRSTAISTPAFGLFEITARVTIANLTMQHGRSGGGTGLIQGGGAIRIAATLNTRLTLTGCTFIDDVAHDSGMFSTSVGGAIYNIMSAPVSLSNCSFQVCNSDGGGGAIYYAQSGALNLTSCTFDSCSSAAIYSAGNTTVANCSFTSCGGVSCTINGCTGAVGGALYFASGTSTVTNSFFSQCSSIAGGAIWNASTLTIVGSTFDSNQSAVPQSFGFPSQGGAILNEGTVSINNSTFYNNAAGTLNDHNAAYGQGGAIYNYGSLNVSLSVVNCTFKDNSAIVQSSPGGASIYNANNSGSNASASVANTIFAGSHPPELLNSGSFTSQGHNLSDDAAGGDATIGPGGLLNAAGDMRNTNPQLASGLQDHGGPTSTIALLMSSPAIDHGNDATALARDQRYYSRSSVSDIGAFEYQGSLVPTSAVSRKVHGDDATVFFDVPLPLTGPIGVECRRSTGSDTTGPNVGHDHQIIVTYPYPVAIDSATSDHGVTIDPVPNGFNQIYTLNLHGTTGLPQRLVLTLTNVHDNGASGNSFQDIIPLGLLVGDTSGNGTVNASDVSQTKLRSGQTVDNTNFRSDLTLNGTINASDVSLVKLKSGTALP
jgi:hypothetical protein